jgi:nucleotide-binding universal stress UspA family protein
VRLPPIPRPIGDQEAAEVRPPGSRDAALALGPILYPCDFSVSSPDALRLAIPLARAYGAEIVALHVIPTNLPAAGGFRSLPNPALLRPHLRHDVSRALDGVLQPARAAAIVARPALREGKPAEEILEVATALRAGLIVMGTHDRGAVDRAVLGSVAETVLRKATCPVLAVPPALLAGAAWPRTVLWATDFSPDARLALRYALSIAEKSGAQLIALHVEEGQDRRHRAFTGRLEERLRGAVALAGGAGLGAEAVVSVGSPAGEILGLARARGADLIVLGASGTGALERMLFGSTVLAVVRAAACPVMVVRPPATGG